MRVLAICLWTWLVGGTVALAQVEGIAKTRAATSSKHALSAANMAELHQLIRLQKGEFKWDALPWYASIWHARRAAAAEDKPILVFGTGGAGFNDPLGNC